MVEAREIKEQRQTASTTWSIPRSTVSRNIRQETKWKYVPSKKRTRNRVDIITERSCFFLRQVAEIESVRVCVFAFFLSFFLSIFRYQRNERNSGVETDGSCVVTWRELLNGRGTIERRSICNRTNCVDWKKETAAGRGCACCIQFT